MPSVSFQNVDIKSVLRNRQQLKQFIPVLFSNNGYTLQSLTVVFCSDEYLLILNKQFLQHDYYTDILTFDLSSGNKIVGEIYISIDRVKENASQLEVPLQDELLRIIFHGTLHLCGFADKSSAEKKNMTEKENEVLLQFKAFHVKQ